MNYCGVNYVRPLEFKRGVWEGVRLTDELKERHSDLLKVDIPADELKELLSELELLGIKNVFAILVTSKGKLIVDDTESLRLQPYGVDEIKVVGSSSALSNNLGLNNILVRDNHAMYAEMPSDYTLYPTAFHVAWYFYQKNKYIMYNGKVVCLTSDVAKEYAALLDVSPSSLIEYILSGKTGPLSSDIIGKFCTMEEVKEFNEDLCSFETMALSALVSVGLTENTMPKDNNEEAANETAITEAPYKFAARFRGFLDSWSDGTLPVQEVSKLLDDAKFLEGLEAEVPGLTGQIVPIMQSNLAKATAKNNPTMAKMNAMQYKKYCAMVS